MNPDYRVAAAFAASCLLAANGMAQPNVGDAARGKALYDSRCIACHSVDANRVGPAHQGVFGRKAGAAPDYAYSDALKKSKVVWNAITLQAWLANPELLIPGQRMGYAVETLADRSDLVAYLATLK